MKENFSEKTKLERKFSFWYHILDSSILGGVQLDKNEYENQVKKIVVVCSRPRPVSSEGKLSAFVFPLSLPPFRLAGRGKQTGRNKYPIPWNKKILAPLLTMNEVSQERKSWLNSRAADANRLLFQLHLRNRLRNVWNFRRTHLTFNVRLST